MDSSSHEPSCAGMVLSSPGVRRVRTVPDYYFEHVRGRLADCRKNCPADAAAALGLLVLLFGIGAVSGRHFVECGDIASPLHAVMDAADRVAEGDYGVRVQEYGPPPMRSLANSFNTMTERLQNADRLRRNVMADVAHELRTPLSVLQGRLEGLIDGVYLRTSSVAELLEETQILSRLIEDLRTLALSDADALPVAKGTDRRGRTRARRRAQPDPGGRKKAASLYPSSSTERAVVDQNPVRIREVLTNLLSNAIRHSATGNAVTVSVNETSERVAVVVRETGGGMSPEEVARSSIASTRGRPRVGLGLGLAIAKSIYRSRRRYSSVE